MKRQISFFALSMCLIAAVSFAQEKAADPVPKELPMSMNEVATVLNQKDAQLNDALLSVAHAKLREGQLEQALRDKQAELDKLKAEPAKSACAEPAVTAPKHGK